MATTALREAPYDDRSRGRKNSGIEPCNSTAGDCTHYTKPGKIGPAAVR
jgi:hypothetical protein